MTSEPTASSDGHGDILAELTAVLAGVVHADPDRVDPDQPFSVLGLDSLLTVEFVSAIGRGFGVSIAGADLYEYATPALLARHLADLRGGTGQVPADRDPGAAAAVLEELRHQLARILHCDPWEIDGGAAFAELGIDSILAADFAAGVNRAYGLSERPVTVHEHPGLAAMAAYIASRTRTTPAPATPDTSAGISAGPLAAAPADALVTAPAGAFATAPITPAGPPPAVPADALAGTLAGPPAAPAATPPALPATTSAALPATTSAALPAIASAVASGAGERSALSRQEVLALLDAVRGDRIGVDEAAALLADRPA
ncbi:phosphopantetheine-binding protein [Streptomyces sp. NPDC127038]|uniref:phosphopantetheine-binding protein n=1 Tax=Streptomyces sp. NPDC127038 TaxID=3347114 RepID=UPI00365E673A